MVVGTGLASELHVESPTSKQDLLPSLAQAPTAIDAEASTDSILPISVKDSIEPSQDSKVPSIMPLGSSIEPQADVEISAGAANQPSVPVQNDEQPVVTSETGEGTEAIDEDGTDFIPPDMEHIVSTGAAQEAASSMEALRELVAQARASSGQQREALPPGFGDEEAVEDIANVAQEQRGEKRKAEDELEQLVRSSAGIDEVRAAAEQSQHPETRTLLQKALSSISGLVSRRPKTDSAAHSPTPTSSTELSALADTKPLAEKEDANVTDDDPSSESEASSSDSSDEDDDDDDEEDAGKAGVTTVAVEDYDDDEGGGPSGGAVPVTKNEILAPEVDQPAIRELTETEKQSLRKLGKVHSIVDSVVVVEQDVQQSKQVDGTVIPVDSTGRSGERQGEYSVLDTGSLLCLEDGKVLGLVFETFGSIHNPMYSIRFASAAAIDRELVKAGKAVFYLPAHSTYVLTQLLRQMKGSDASNIWDEEVAEDEIDYSDDEQELEAKRRAKAIRSGNVDDQGNPLSAPSLRGNKRQKQHGAEASNSSTHQSANGSFNQQSGYGGSGTTRSGASQAASQQRSHNNAQSSLPRRNIGGQNLPLPSAPARSGPPGPALLQGIRSLPSRPPAGLPSKPSFVSDASMSVHRDSSELGTGAASIDANAGSTPRSRMESTDSSGGGQVHSRLNSAAASSLPAKPVDAAAAASASSPSNRNATASASPFRSAAGVAGASSPPHASRPASTRTGPSATAAAHHHQVSPNWYAGSPNMSASSAGPSQYGAARNPAYNSGLGGPVAVQGGGHYNPAYAGHWQHAYGPTATSSRPQSSVAGVHAWNGPQSYPAAPLHMTPGAVTQHSYGGYGGAHGGYGAPPPPVAGAGGQGGSAGHVWNNQTYPGSHYPGYTDSHYGPPSNAPAATNASRHGTQGYYAPSAQAYGYPSQDAYAYQAPAYPASVGYGAAPAAHNGAASSAAQDSYDPTSPALNSGNGHNQHAGSSS